MGSSFPKLVVIEGVDAVGKTTIARMIEEAFGYTYLYTPQEPFSVIRNLVEEMQDRCVRVPAIMLPDQSMLAARVHHDPVHKYLAPN